MTIITPLPFDLFEIGKCYSMTRSGTEIKFQVHSFDEERKSFALKMNFSRMDILQLYASEILTIKEITEEELGKVVSIDERGVTRAINRT